uniref:Uncharacterized protein n=1 Tax=Parastrongyloides trichosuri TaxID=131310 RepID=A0A0N4Z9Y5_PARTI
MSSVDGLQKNCVSLNEENQSLLIQRNWFLALLIVTLVISLIVIIFLIWRYKSKFKLSKDKVMRDQATKFVKIVHEVRGQENKCKDAMTKGYCPKKVCNECNNKDDDDDDLAKTIVIYIPKGVNLDEATERKLNLLAMSDDIRNFNCFNNINPCKGRCLDETTNTSLMSTQNRLSSQGAKIEKEDTKSISEKSLSTETTANTPKKKRGKSRRSRRQKKVKSDDRSLSSPSSSIQTQTTSKEIKTQDLK